MAALQFLVIVLALITNPTRPHGAAGHSIAPADDDQGLVRLKLYRTPTDEPVAAQIDSRMKQLFASLNETSNAGKSQQQLRSQTLTNINGINFFANIKLGNPAKTFRVLLDTGSYDLWLPSAACKDLNCRIRNNYNSLESTNYIADGRKVFVRYANQVEISGHLSTDSLKFNQLLVQQQTFIEAMKLTGDSLAEMPFDGILGISVPHEDAKEISTSARHKSPIVNLLEHKAVARKIFGFSVRHLQNSDEAGQMILGGIDRSVYRGEITWIPLISFKKWEFRMDYVGMLDRTSNRMLTNVCRFGCSAVPDTGTFLIGGYSEDIAALNRQVGAFDIGGGVFAFKDEDCLNYGKMPNLVFVIAGRDFVLTPNLYIIKTPERCYSALRTVEGLPHWILGDLFLSNFYSIFDYENKRLGLAESIY